MTHRIHAKGPFVQEEYTAGEAISPGHLVDIHNNGLLYKHDVPEGKAERMFAQEDALQGKTIDDNYAAGDIVTVILPVLGAEVQAWLINDQIVSIGDWLVSNGDGCLRREDEGSGFTDTRVVAVAMESLDTVNDSSTSARRIRVRIAAQ